MSLSRYQDVIIAGFGGQGVLLIGNLLAYAAMEEGLHITFMPVYGVEMRGGTANCTVVIAEDEIGSPIIHNPRSLIAMNQPSLEKFQPRLEDSGVQVVNSSIVDPGLVDMVRVRSVMIPVNDLADELGNVKMANMVALGAWLEATRTLSMESVHKALEQVISARNNHLIPKNREALTRGAVYVREEKVSTAGFASGRADRSVAEG
jgi:2-oxoglutarate ferredoxin oxidoreductase subunit gamma